MNYNDLKQLLKKSGIRILLVGIFILLIGVPLMLAYFLGEKQTAALVIGIIFLLIGLLMVVKSIADLSKIKSESHPLLSAIRNGDKSFIIWVYQKQITSKVEGAKVGVSNNIVLTTNSNKMIEVVLNKKASPDTFIDYIESQFPDALVGFSDENAAKVKAHFKK